MGAGSFPTTAATVGSLERSCTVLQLELSLERQAKLRALDRLEVQDRQIDQLLQEIAALTNRQTTLSVDASPRCNA
jgi:hypothetical protein